MFHSIEVSENSNSCDDLLRCQLLQYSCIYEQILNCFAMLLSINYYELRLDPIYFNRSILYIFWLQSLHRLLTFISDLTKDRQANYFRPYIQLNNIFSITHTPAVHKSMNMCVHRKSWNIKSLRKCIKMKQRW